MTWDQVLLTFLRAAFLSSNGSTTLTVLEEDLVQHLKVLTRSDFALGTAIGAATPGPLGFGCIALGFLADGWRGAIVATLTSWLPALLAIPLHWWVRRLEGRPWFSGMMWGLTAGGAGLLLAMTVGMGEQSLRGWRELLIAGIALALVWRRAHAAVVIAASALLGVLLFR